MNWLEDCEKEAKELSQEKRQEFLDRMYEGNNLGKSAELTGISFDAACGIMNMNIENRLTLRRESL